MDNVSISKANSLYWLGRYTERAYKLAHILTEYYDKMVDDDENAYKGFCENLGIEIKAQNKDAFLKELIADKDCPASIASSLSRAYDNSIILRGQIDTESVAYIQLAYNNVTRLFKDKCRIYDLQSVVDNLMSFWGAVDDYIIEDDIRDTIKAGKYMERLDLFCRFDREMYKIAGCQRRLGRYVAHLDTEKRCTELESLFCYDSLPDTEKIAACVGRLFES
ncbi:MAG: alpha-E domain-containing protein [Eubacterium sp.]|nr:alpha-E domain-containing protein [Eubacterium sp.]